MKKIAALVLALALIFALCACGETTAAETVAETVKEIRVEVPTVPEQYQKYKDLVDALEAGDYDAALAFIDGMAPAPELPPSVEVQITTENFADYFEYREMPEPFRREETDADGNVILVFRSGYYLKDGYTIAADKAGDCRVEVGLKYEQHWFYDGKNIQTDLENVSYTVRGKAEGVWECDRMCEASYVNFLVDTDPFFYVLVSETRLAENNGNTCIIPEENIELVSAAGTLFLYE